MCLYVCFVCVFVCVFVYLFYVFLSMSGCVFECVCVCDGYFYNTTGRFASNAAQALGAFKYEVFVQKPMYIRSAQLRKRAVYERVTLTTDTYTHSQCCASCWSGAGSGTPLLGRA